ncbi:MAG: hypothetical protein ABSB24_05060 [Gaiellaceae bacterium]|jgi:hypothetical protein
MKRARALACTGALAILGLLAIAAAGSPGLVWRHSHRAGFSVKLPADWRYRDASYPSDHSTEYWTDPSDAHSLLEVEVSGCVGCVQPTSCVLHQTGCGPAPQQVIPAHTLSTTKLGPWRLRFVARTPGTSYLDRGLVAILHHNNQIEGFAYIQTWLPAAQAQLADTILASYTG